MSKYQRIDTLREWAKKVRIGALIVEILLLLAFVWSVTDEANVNSLLLRLFVTAAIVWGIAFYIEDNPEKFIIDDD